jgi:hypothetical protein
VTTPLTTDDLVTGRAAESLGEGVLPTRAVLIIETVESEGRGLRYVLAEGMTTWDAIGMVRSALLRIEESDRDYWEGEDGEL